jgi:Tfp pilus assembly protein PilV
VTAPRAAGFTFVEALLAVVLLAVTVTTMVVALDHVRTVNQENDDAAIATHLLHDGIARARILRRTGSATAVADPDDAASVEDLNGVGEVAPNDLAGAVFSTEWKRTWSVAHADVDAPLNNATATSTTLLRVTVAVAKNGVEEAAETFLLSKTP